MSPRYDGFLPGQPIIEGYRSGGFHFAGMSHRGSILALPSGIHIWNVGHISQMDMASLVTILA